MSKSSNDLKTIMENLGDIDFDKVRSLDLKWKMLIDPDVYGENTVLPELSIVFKD